MVIYGTVDITTAFTADSITFDPEDSEAFEKTQEFLFAFIPRDTKGTEVRYDVNVRHEAEVTPEIKTVPETGPVENMLVIVAITVALYAGYRALAGRKA